MEGRGGLPFFIKSETYGPIEIQRNCKSGRRRARLYGGGDEPNEDVYNMEVIGTHNFAVNGGVIVHNCMDDIRYFVNTVLRHKSGNNNNTFWKEW